MLARSRFARVGNPNSPARGTAALALIAGAAALFGCGGEDVAGPTDTTALAAEVEAAFAVLASTAFGEVGRGVRYDEVLGGRGPETIAAHAGTLFRWSLDENRYVGADEPGPYGGVRFVLCAALETVPHGAPLVETGSIAWFPADGGGLRAELTTEHGARLELTATGESRPVPQTQTRTITGSVAAASARLRAEAEADPVQFDVEYDDELGYPTRASVDVRAEIADDEYTFRVTDFQELEPLTE